MSAFPAAVQDFVEALRTEQHEAALAAFQAAMDQAGSATRDEAGALLLDLTERLVANPGRYGGLLACLCEACLTAGGDPWVCTGLLVERLCAVIQDAARFDRTCRDRLSAGGLAEDGDAADEMRVAVAGEDAAGAAAWSELDLWCVSATGLLAYFPEARRLFRHLGGSIDTLRPLALGRRGPDELVRQLAGHADEPVPAGFPTAAVDTALARLRQVTTTANTNANAAALQEVYQALFCVDQATRNHALRGLAELVRTGDITHTGDLGETCGGLVEVGCDPSLAVDVLVGRLRDVLPRATAFVRHCLDKARQKKRNLDEEDPANLVEAFAPLVARTEPDGQRAFAAAGPLCLGTIAHLARSVEARRRVRFDPELVSLTHELGPALGPAGFLHKMLRVLDDEEIVVLAPQERRGWRVRIGGIGDNFQLHTLLAGSLGDGCPGQVGVAGDGPEGGGARGPLPPRAVGVARDLPCAPREPTVWSHLQLWTWPALQPDGRLPANPLAHTDWFVWNEGVPADILACHGQRVILLGPAPFSRSWNGGRIFHGMDARFDVIAPLTDDEVTTWMQRLTTTPHPRIG